MKLQSTFAILTTSFSLMACSAKQANVNTTHIDQSIVLLDAPNGLSLNEGDKVNLRAVVQGDSSTTMVSWYTRGQVLCQWSEPDAKGVSNCEFEVPPYISTIYVESQTKSGNTRIAGWNVDILDISADSME